MTDKQIYEELVEEYGKPITVRDIDEWTKIVAMGDYEMDYKNGCIYSWNSHNYYLSHFNLTTKDLEELNYFYSNF